jgi:hypothetical protein
MGSASRSGAKRGRPKTTGPGSSIHLRLLPAELLALDAVREAEGDAPSRPEMIRRLLTQSFAAAGFGHLIQAEELS